MKRRHNGVTTSNGTDTSANYQIGVGTILSAPDAKKGTIPVRRGNSYPRSSSSMADMQTSRLAPRRVESQPDRDPALFRRPFSAAQQDSRPRPASVTGMTDVELIDREILTRCPPATGVRPSIDSSRRGVAYCIQSCKLFAEPGTANESCGRTVGSMPLVA